MSVVEQILSGSWEHSEDEDRIEQVAIHNPDIVEQMSRLALRFISAKGLSAEFAEALEEIQFIENFPERLGVFHGDEPDADTSPSL